MCVYVCRWLTISLKTATEMLKQPISSGYNLPLYRVLLHVCCDVA